MRPHEFSRLGISRFAWVLLFSFVWCAGDSGVKAQVPALSDQVVPNVAETPKFELPTMEELDVRIKAIESDESLSEAKQTSILKSLKDTAAAIKGIAATQSNTKDLASAADEASSRIKTLRSSLDQPLSQNKSALSANATLEQLKGDKSAAQGLLTELTKQLEAVRETIRIRREELQQLPQQIVELRTQIEKARDDASDAAEGDDPDVLQAAVLAREATIAEAKAKIDLANQKLRTFEAEADLLPLQQSDVERRISFTANQLEEISRRLGDERKIDINERISTFEERIEPVADSLLLLGETKALVDQWPNLVDVSRLYEKQLVELKAQTAELKSDYDNTQTLIGRDLATGGGLSQALGFLLQRKRAKLQAASNIGRQRDKVSDEIDDTQNSLTRVDAILGDLPVARLSGAGVLGGADARIANAANEEAIESQRSILKALSADADRLLSETLMPLGLEYDVYMILVADYQALVDEHLLWVRSDDPFQWIDLTQSITSFRDLFGWDHWVAVGRAMGTLFKNDPVTMFAWIIVVALLFAVRPWFSRLVATLGEQAQKRTSMEMRPTFEAMVATIMLSLPLALVFGMPGRLLARGFQAEPFILAVADAMVTMAAVILPLEFLRQFIRPCGVAIAHFGWPPAAIKPVRQAVRGVFFSILPLVFLWRLSQVLSENETELASLARLLFVVLMILVSFLAWRVLHPRRGAVAVLIMSNPSGWIERLRWIWHPLISLVPVGLACLMLIGYGYSALQLAVRSYYTIWIFIVAGLCFGATIRWLTISRRRLAIQQLRERNASKAQSVGVEGPQVEIFDDKQADLSTINLQSRRLVDAIMFVAILIGVYYIWSPVFPALGFLERVVLWKQTSVDGTVLDTITLANLVLAVPILMITFVVVRNAPGLLETSLLQRLPLENAVRYAITTLSSYLIAAIGVSAAATTLGLHWSSIQWLIAGLGVGLGFGLQEIFANFISGIILLFEQPIRVGDVVTMDGTTGIVSRIRMRATTITNWDRQEYVVPNKDFITGRLVNWTLSDTTNRVVINVGIAYGSDTRKACALLNEICAQHPDILEDPGTVITFEGFGDSTLNLVLRFYLGSLERRLSVIHEVHTEINDRFKREGIEIAFPQRDLHIRTLPDSFPGIRQAENPASD